MKSAIKTVIAAVAVCAFAVPASAYTLTGNVPAGAAFAVITLQKPIPAGFIRLTITLPQPTSAGTGYVADFCVGPTKIHCGLPQQIPGGQRIIAIYSGRTLQLNYLTLTQSTSAAVPYIVEVDVVP